jgi:hypothetical protein
MHRTFHKDSSRGRFDLSALAKSALAERNKLPINLTIYNFQPSHTRGRTAVWPHNAAGIQKQDSSAFFVSRDVRVPMQENIDIVGCLLRREMLQTEFQSAAHKIDNQWPFEITVAVSAHDRDLRSNRSQLVEYAFRANISKVPDFICSLADFLHFLRQTIVRVRQDEDANCFSRFFLLYHCAF